MKGNNYAGLLDSNFEKNTEAKYNIFKFQDHLLYWIHYAADAFVNRNYPNSLECLSLVYQDVNGFFDEKERKQLDKLWEEALKECNKYINYNSDFTKKVIQIKECRYVPPSGVYKTLISFRKELMKAMAKHNMLMIMIKKSQAGAGSQM